MKNDIDDLLNNLFPNGRLNKDVTKKSNKQTTKKNTTTIPNKTTNPDTLLKEMDELSKGLQEMIDEQNKELSSFNQLDQQQIDKINEEVKKDFQLDIEPKKQTAQVSLDDFEVIKQKLSKQLIGQSDYINQLTIAFKRPLVLKEENNLPKSTILITGNKGTGKHSSITFMADALYQHHFISSQQIQSIDLTNYSNQEQEKLFLQDLFMALQHKDSIVVFDHIEAIAPYYLTMLTSLITTGKIKLNKRYVLQKGQLVEVSNALVSSAISSIDANQKYLIFISDMKENKLLEQLGISFIKGIKDFISTKNVEADAIKEIATNLLEELKTKVDKNLDFKLRYDNSILTYLLEQYTHDKGVLSIQDNIDYFYRSLSEYKLQNTIKDSLEVELQYINHQLQIKLPTKEILLSELIPVRLQNSLHEIKEELQQIIGLKEIKEYVLSLEDHYHIQQIRKKEGLKTSEISRHMIFTGNPGTGKTTIARLISKYFKAIGILSNGQLVEVTRADLVGRYVGHTAPLTNSVINSAMGGVLFIDEAYSLYRGKDDTFGLEAIDTLVKAMEDYRDEFIVILAGYSKEMKEFLQANSGLKSRFPNIIDFPDYTAQELLEIAQNIAKSKDYMIDETAIPALKEYFEQKQSTSAMSSGNGRMARNVVEAAILNQSKRLIVETKAPMDILIVKDFDLMNDSI